MASVSEDSSFSEDFQRSLNEILVSQENNQSDQKPLWSKKSARQFLCITNGEAKKYKKDRNEGNGENKARQDDLQKDNLNKSQQVEGLNKKDHDEDERKQDGNCELKQECNISNLFEKQEIEMVNMNNFDQDLNNNNSNYLSQMIEQNMDKILVEANQIQILRDSQIKNQSNDRLNTSQENEKNKQIECKSISQKQISQNNHDADTSKPIQAIISQPRSQIQRNNKRNLTAGHFDKYQTVLQKDKSPSTWQNSSIPIKNQEQMGIYGTNSRLKGLNLDEKRQNSLDQNNILKNNLNFSNYSGQQSNNNQITYLTPSSPTTIRILTVLKRAKISYLISSCTFWLSSQLRMRMHTKNKHFRRIEDKASEWAEGDDQSANTQKFFFLLAKKIATILNHLPCASPFSLFKTIWDICSIILLLYSFWLTSISISIGHSYERLNGDILLRWILPIYLLFDILVTMNTGYNKNGFDITSREQVLQHYYQEGGLILDIIGFFSICLCIGRQSHEDEDFDNYSDITTYILIFYFVKVSALRRLIKRLTDRLNLSQGKKNILALLKLLITLLFICHSIANIWLFVGRYQQLLVGNSYLEKRNIYYQTTWKVWYVQTVYYVLVTMTTVGYGDIVPATTFEFIVCILIMLGASGVFAYNLNVIGAILDGFYRQERLIDEKMSVINQYMSRNSINLNLRQQIRDFLENYWNECAEKQYALEASIINDLPEILKDNLVTEVNRLFLQKSPIFKKNFSQQICKQLTHLLQEIRFSPNQIICQKNVLDDSSIYFIRNGNVGVSCVENNISFSLLQSNQNIQSMEQNQKQQQQSQQEQSKQQSQVKQKQQKPINMLSSNTNISQQNSSSSQQPQQISQMPINKISLQNAISIESILSKSQSELPLNSYQMLSQGETFGELSFFTGLPRQATITAIDFTTLVKIDRQEFISILKTSPIDYEKFCLIKDRITHRSTFEDIGVKCYFCKRDDHLMEKCPLIHIVPLKSTTIKKYLYNPGNQNRSTFKRNIKDKFSTLKDKDILEEVIERLNVEYPHYFIEDNSYEEQVDSQDDSFSYYSSDSSNFSCQEGKKEKEELIEIESNLRNKKNITFQNHILSFKQNFEEDSHNKQYCSYNNNNDIMKNSLLKNVKKSTIFEKQQDESTIIKKKSKSVIFANVDEIISSPSNMSFKNLLQDNTNSSHSSSSDHSPQENENDKNHKKRNKKQKQLNMNNYLDAKEEDLIEESYECFNSPNSFDLISHSASLRRDNHQDSIQEEKNSYNLKKEIVQNIEHQKNELLEMRKKAGDQLSETKQNIETSSSSEDEEDEENSIESQEQLKNEDQKNSKYKIERSINQNKESLQQQKKEEDQIETRNGEQTSIFNLQNQEKLVPPIDGLSPLNNHIKQSFYEALSSKPYRSSFAIGMKKDFKFSVNNNNRSSLINNFYSKSMKKQKMANIDEERKSSQSSSRKSSMNFNRQSSDQFSGHSNLNSSSSCSNNSNQFNMYQQNIFQPRESVLKQQQRRKSEMKFPGFDNKNRNPKFKPFYQNDANNTSNQPLLNLLIHKLADKFLNEQIADQHNSILKRTSDMIDNEFEQIKEYQIYYPKYNSSIVIAKYQEIKQKINLNGFLMAIKTGKMGESKAIDPLFDLDSKWQRSSLFPIRSSNKHQTMIQLAN